MASIGTVSLLLFATVVFKMDDLFKLIKKTEVVIIKSDGKLLTKMLSIVELNIEILDLDDKPHWNSGTLISFR